MRTIIVLLIFIVGVCLLMSCEKETIPGAKNDDSGTVTIPFISHFTTTFNKSILSESDKRCEPDQVCQLIQTGSGIDESIGNFDLYLNCCWRLVNGEHLSTECYITDIDGDILNLKCKETDDAIIFSPDFPYDMVSMCSEYQFTGGTGKFANATGSVNVECCLMSASDSQLSHNWEGSLTMVNK